MARGKRRPMSGHGLRRAQNMRTRRTDDSSNVQSEDIPSVQSDHTPTVQSVANFTIPPDAATASAFGAYKLELVETLQGPRYVIQDPVPAESSTTSTEADRQSSAPKNDTKLQRPSIFRHERTEPLHPSQVHPTSNIEHENNILHVQDIGKQYQLAVKDYNIQVRDNRIKAKDKQITHLETENRAKDARNTYLRRCLQNCRVDVKANCDMREYIEKQLRRQEHESCETTNRLTESLSQAQFDLNLRNKTVSVQDDELRLLRNEVCMSRKEIQDLKTRRLMDHFLDWIRGFLKGTSDTEAAPEPTFPFMKLPGELRALVYKHALVLHRPIDLWPMMPADAPRGTDHSTILNQDLKQINTSLLRVSRQVHMEAAYVLYRYNRFRFSGLGGWTILGGFLFSIGSNCNNLTSISVTYPDSGVHDFVTQGNEPFLEYLYEKVRYVLQKRFKVTLNAPNGPSTNSYDALVQARDILDKLPALKTLSIIVPHTYLLRSYGIEFVSQVYHIGRTKPKYKRSYILCRRNSDQPPFMGQPHNLTNVDDDFEMGRLELKAAAISDGISIKAASYGKHADRVSYVVDGGDEPNELDLEIPEYVEQPGSNGFIVWLHKFMAG